MINYKAGDVVEQWCFGCPEASRMVVVDARYSEVKNGRAGFDGHLLGSGVNVWGYDSDVHRVLLSCEVPQ
jgi:hypothetical protein